MKYKRGQITPLAIIGLIILVGIIGALIFSNKLIFEGKKTQLDKNVDLNEDQIEVKDFVDGCITEVAKANILYMGQRGGYFNDPLEATDFKVPYYVDKGADLRPGLSKLEDEISDSITSELRYCIDDFKVFKEFGITTEEEMSTKTTITDGNVALEVYFPLEIKRLDSVSKLDSFAVNIPIRLGKVYGVTTVLLDDQLRNPDSFCINCYITTAYYDDFYYHLYRYGEDTVVFTVEDVNTTRTHLPFNFTYAVRY